MKKILLSIFLCHAQCLWTATIGSNTTVSRQATPMFVGSKNSMIGFGAFANGFTLQDGSTSCSYDNFFPISGNINLNSGKIYLQQDLKLSNTLPFMTVGTIFGSNHAIILPDQTTTFSFPAIGLGIRRIDSGGNYGLSIDWNLSGTAIYTTFEDFIEEYSFDGTTEQIVSGYPIGEFDQLLYCIRWNPNANWAAYCGTPSYKIPATNNLGTISFDPDNGYRLGGSATLTGTMGALNWHPTGNYLVVSRSDGANTRLYSFNRSTAAIAALGASVASQCNTKPGVVSWSNRGNNYVSIGKANGNIDTYSFNPGSPGSGLSSWLNITVSTTATPVNAVDWCPTGSFLAVGIQGSSQNLRIFQQTFGPSALTNKPSAYVNFPSAVNSLHWHPSGKFLAVGEGDVSLTVTFPRTFIYSFDPSAVTLSLLGTIRFTQITVGYQYTNDLRWSKDGKFIHLQSGAGTTLGNYFVGKFDKVESQMNFFDTTIVCKNNLIAAGNVSFGGTCKIIGTKNNNIITMGADKTIFVRPGGNLTFENIQLSGVKTGNLVCMNNSASITLNNAQMQLSSNYNFTSGSLFFDRDCSISGTSKFTYNSVMTSTIGKQSSLTLDHGTTFSYDPRVNNPNLISLTDQSSRLILRDSNLVATKVGLALDTGSLYIDGNVTFSSQAGKYSEGIFLKASLCANILGASTLNCYGFVNYDMGIPTGFTASIITNTATNRILNMLEWQRSFTNVHIASRGAFTSLHFDGSHLNKIAIYLANFISVRGYRRNASEPLAVDDGAVTSPVDGGVSWFTFNDSIVTGGAGITSIGSNSFHSSFLIPPIPTNIIMFYDNSSSVLATLRISPIAFTAIAAAPEKSQAHALAPALTGQYYAVGTRKILAGEGKFQILNYGGLGTLSTTIGFTVQTLDWNPTGSFIAMGLHGSTDNLRIFKHIPSPASVTEQTSLATTMIKNINTVAWSWDGNFLAAGSQDGTNSKVYIYAFNKTTAQLTPMLDFPTYTPTFVKSIRWSSDINNPMLVVGLDDGNVTLYQLTPEC